MQTIWLKGVPEDRKDEVRKTIKNSQVVLERLQLIVAAYLDQVENDEESDENFLNPEYHVRQARNIGRRYELKRLKSIIDGAINE